MTPRITSFAPQFLVDDFDRSIEYYKKLGFTFDDPWDGFYAIGDVEMTQVAKALVQLASDRTINDKDTLNERVGSLMSQIKQTQKQSDEQFDEGVRLLRNQ